MFRAIFTLMLCITSILYIYAYDFVVDGIYYNKLNYSIIPENYEGNLCEVTYGTNKYKGDLVIPTTVTYNDEVYTVIGIGNEAMKDCNELCTVSLGHDSRLLTIGAWAFYNCTMLKSFDVPSSVTGIDYMAFNGCTSFKDFTLPANVRALADLAFPALERLTIEDSNVPLDCVTAHSFDAFSLSHHDIDTLYMGRDLNGLQEDYSALEYGGMGQHVQTLIVGPMCTWIAPFSFVKANRLKEIIGMENVRTIDHNAFYICQNLESLYLKDVWVGNDGLLLERVGDLDVTLDGWSIEFENDPQLKPTSLNYVSNAEWFTMSHMLNGYKLDSIRISNLSSYIKATPLVAYDTDRDIIYTINGDKINNLSIPTDCSVINEGKFANCQSITMLNIHKNVYQIGDYAFKNCRSLVRINCDSEWPPECNETTFRGVYKEACVVTVPVGCKVRYESADGWKDFPFIEEYDPTGITDIKAENDIETMTFDLLGRKITPSVTLKPSIIKSNIIIR